MTRRATSGGPYIWKLDILDVDSSATYPKSGVFQSSFIRTESDYYVEVGRCRLTVSQLVLKAPMISAREGRCRLTV